MTATADSHNDSTNDQHGSSQHGIKGVFAGAVDQVQTRLKDVEKALNGAVEQLQTRLKEASDDVEKRFDAIKGSLKRLKSGDDADHAEGGEVTEQLVEKLGFARIADVEAIKALAEKLSGRLDTLKKKLTTDSVSKADFKKLADRVAKLEKATDAEG